MTASLASVAFPALGTTAVIVAPAPALTAARPAVEAEIHAVDAACSRFREDSELSLLNAAGGRPFPASPLLRQALSVALRAARLTDGWVDPTVGTAIRVLGYDRTFARVEQDGGPLRVTVGPVPGWRLIEVDPASATIRLPASVTLDLGATAKALCADRAARAAADAAGSGVLVNLGGDIAVAGAAPEGGWSVRVTDDHAAPPDAPGQTVAIADGGLATSGTAVRRWARGGRSLHHLVDPSTGMPADTPWRTVSVAARSCVDANIASTAAVIMGTRAPEWLEARGLPARLVSVNGQVTTLAGWPADPAWAVVRSSC
jgi:thiamine biosynthesis lipoprotein